MKRLSVISLIFSLLFVFSCEDKKDNDNTPFSIIGTWEYHFRSEGDWNKYLGWTSEFKTDGTYFENKINRTNTWSYNLCESNNVLKIFNSSNPSTENCDCIQNSYNFNIVYEGKKTFYLNSCSGNPSLKFVKIN